MSQQANQYDSNLIDELGITKDHAERVIKRYKDLQVQAMMFDLDIDIETFDLVAKKKEGSPEWLVRWSDQRAEGDFDERFDIDQE